MHDIDDEPLRHRLETELKAESDWALSMSSPGDENDEPMAPESTPSRKRKSSSTDDPGDGKRARKTVHADDEGSLAEGTLASRKGRISERHSRVEHAQDCESGGNMDLDVDLGQGYSCDEEGRAPGHVSDRDADEEDEADETYVPQGERRSAPARKVKHDVKGKGKPKPKSKVTVRATESSLPDLVPDWEERLLEEFRKVKTMADAEDWKVRRPGASPVTLALTCSKRLAGDAFPIKCQCCATRRPVDAMCVRYDSPGQPRCEFCVEHGVSCVRSAWVGRVAREQGIEIPDGGRMNGAKKNKNVAPSAVRNPKTRRLSSPSNVKLEVQPKSRRRSTSFPEQDPGDDVLERGHSHGDIEVEQILDPIRATEGPRSPDHAPPNGPSSSARRVSVDDDVAAAHIAEIVECQSRFAGNWRQTMAPVYEIIRKTENIVKTLPAEDGSSVVGRLRDLIAKVNYDVIADLQTAMDCDLRGQVRNQAEGAGVSGEEVVVLAEEEAAPGSS